MICAVRGLASLALQLLETFAVDVVDERLPSAFAQQFDGGPEGDEVAQSRHVDSVAVRIADLRGRRADDDLARLEPVEYPDDALPQRRAPHDRIVEDHQIVFPGTYRAVGDVVDVGLNRRISLSRCSVSEPFS